EEESQTFIEVMTPGDHKLVTAIEVLSPSNKRGPGASDYFKKRQEYLASSAHYLEIDFLRIGEQFRVRSTLPSTPYFVFLSRADQRPRVEVWPIAMEARLPIVPVPLLPEDADVSLDLQLAVDAVHDVFGYDAVVNYRKPPTVPLDSAQSQWADDRLKQSGAR
ncbi:MAG: DUF4058 family protein, partial [Aquabacterium sp.]|nr:DUF4058 family protein [Aquabacterium sp.]